MVTSDVLPVKELYISTLYIQIRLQSRRVQNEIIQQLVARWMLIFLHPQEEEWYKRILQVMLKLQLPAGKPSIKYCIRLSRRQSFLKVGNAAVRIHTMKSSLRKPLFPGSSPSSSQTGLAQHGGFVVPVGGKSLTWLRKIIYTLQFSLEQRE